MCLCLCVRGNISNASPWYCDAGLCAVHLLGFGCWQILAWSAWYCSKVRGQPAGSASWWQAQQGGLPITVEKKEKKSKASSKYHGPKSIYKTDIPLFICHRSETQKHTWTTVLLEVWSVNMCNEIGAYESMWIWNGVGLSSKLFIGDRWGVTDTEISFQEHQQLSHLPLRSVTNGHI